MSGGCIARAVLCGVGRVYSVVVMWQEGIGMLDFEREGLFLLYFTVVFPDDGGQENIKVGKRRKGNSRKEGLTERLIEDGECF